LSLQDSPSTMKKSPRFQGKLKAHANGWLGEVDGLEVTLATAELKLAAMRRASNPPTTVVELGLPTAEPRRPDRNDK